MNMKLRKIVVPIIAVVIFLLLWELLVLLMAGQIIKWRRLQTLALHFGSIKNCFSPWVGKPFGVLFSGF